MMIRFRYIAIALICLTWLPHCGWGQLNKAYFFYKGEEYMAKGQYNMAMPYLNTLIGIDSTIAEGWLMRGVAKYNLGDVHGALADLSRSSAVNPLLSQAHNYKAIVLNRLNQHGRALAEALSAIDLKPNSPEFRHTLGVTYLYLGEYEKAQEAFSRIIRFDKTIAEAWLNRGTARQLASDTLGALDDYNRAIGLNPFSAYAYMRRGALRLDQRELDLALADLDRAVELDSVYKEPLMARAITRYERNEPHLALADLNQLLRLEPSYPLGLYNRALILNQLGQWQEAILDLNRLSALNPENVLIYYNRANMLLDHGRAREALDDYTTAINIFPDFANAYLNRALAKHRLGDRKGAQADHIAGQQLLQRYSADGSKAGPMALLDSARLSRLISLESDFNAAMRLGLKANRFRVAAAFLPMARLAVIGALSNAMAVEADEASVGAIDSGLPKEIRIGLRMQEGPEVPMTVSQVDSLLPKNHSLRPLLRGLALADDGKLAEANLAIERALAAYPDNLWIRLTAIALRVDMARFVESFGAGGVELGRPAPTGGGQPTMTAYKDAVAELQQLQEQNPHHAHIMYNLGNMHVLLNDYAGAIRWYDRALDIQPKLASALYNRGLARLLSGSQRDGCRDLSLAGELGVGAAYEALQRFCDV